MQVSPSAVSARAAVTHFNFDIPPSNAAPGRCTSTQCSLQPRLGEEQSLGGVASAQHLWPDRAPPLTQRGVPLGRTQDPPTGPAASSPSQSLFVLEEQCSSHKCASLN